MLATWAPADLFTPLLNGVVFSLGGVASYLSEHLLVLLAVMVLIAALIGFVGRRGR